MSRAELFIGNEKPKGDIRRTLRALAGQTREQRSTSGLLHLTVLKGGTPVRERLHKTPAQIDQRVHLSMFHPASLARGDLEGFTKKFYGNPWYVKWIATAAQPKIQESQARKRAAYGEKGGDLEKYDQRRKELAKRITQRVNTHFISAVASHFSVSGSPELLSKSVSEFEAKHVEIANATVRQFRETLYPQIPHILLPRTEIDSAPPSAVQRIRDIATGDDTRKFEETRQLLFAFLSAEDSIYKDGLIADKKQSQITTLLAKKLFGSIPQWVTIRGLFDNNTNDIAYLEGEGKPLSSPLPENSHVKSFIIPMRTMKGINGESDISVFFDPNRKTDQSTLIKSLRDAEKRARKGKNDAITPEVDARDRNRIGVAVAGGKDEVQLVIKNIFDTFKNNQEMLADRDETEEPIIDFIDKKGDIQYKGRFLKAELKPRNRDDEAQSDFVDFERYELYFEGLSYPFELKVQTFEQYLRESIHVGKFDPSKRKYTGAGYPLVRIAQLDRISEFILPKKLYEREPADPTLPKRKRRKFINLEKAAMRTLHEKAKQLLSEGKDKGA